MAAKKIDRSSKNKPAKKDKPDEKSFSLSRAKDFFGEVKSEFKKIVWPDKKVTFGLTGFVMILVVLVSIYLGSVDLLLGKLVTMVLR